MRASRWLLGISAMSLVAVGGIAAGCSSSSSGTPQPAEDGSTEAAGDDGSTVCHVDASLAAFASSDAAGAGCAACVQSMCSAGIMACSNSCTCVSLFSCLADAGVSASGLTTDFSALGACVPGGISSAGMLLNDPGVMGVYSCFTVTCADQCASLVPTPEGGTTDDAGGGSPEAGASTDAGGTTADAADGG